MQKLLVLAALCVAVVSAGKPGGSCKASRKCESGCISEAACAAKNVDGHVFTWDDKACGGGKEDDCGCCTEPSATCVDRADKCTEKGGFCTSPEECPKSETQRFVPGFCRDDGKTSPKTCGCCIVESNCPKADEGCSAFIGGRCEGVEAVCEAAGSFFDGAACGGGSVIEGTNSTSTCGCCHSGCVKVDDACSAKGGKCVKSEADCNADLGFVFNSTDCHASNNGTAIDAPCGCCVPPETPEACGNPQQCIVQGGVCMDNADEELCDLAEYEWKESFCGGRNSKCGCCKPKKKRGGPK